MEPLLETRGVTVKFGSFVANDSVDFTCEKGSIVSLLGENGAGKTTLMKAIYGMNKLSGGEILFEGKPVRLRSPRDAIRLGIQMVHQHFMLVDDLSVTENVVMGKEPSRLGLFQQKKAEQAVRELSEQYGLHVDPQKKVRDLTVGAKQRTEILKALYHGAKLLILDEPTAVLTPQETDELFKIMRVLKESGKSVIIITHKLQETMEIADTVYILRRGHMVGSVAKADTDPVRLAQMMVDGEIGTFERQKASPGEVVLNMRDVSLCEEDGTPRLNGLNLSVRAGEIYGIAGIEGNGQQELAETITGLRRDWSGEIEVLGSSIQGLFPDQMIGMGVSCVHSDRHDRGLLLGLDAAQNVLLGYQSDPAFHKHRFLLDPSAYRRAAEEIFAAYQVHPNVVSNLAGSFSGGNQQKIIVGREFRRDPKLAIVAYPTRGVDIGASLIIHKSILRLRDAGAAIILITADFDELFRLSDRIGVLYEGQIIAEDVSEAFTPKKLGYYMGGGREFHLWGEPAAAGQSSAEGGRLQ